MAAGGGGAVRYAVILSDDPFGAAAIAHVTQLQRDLPRLVRESGLGPVRASVTGDTVAAAETVNGLAGSLPPIAIAIAAVDLALMALLLRAIVAPLVLVGVSALAAAAPLGLTALLFARLGHPYQDFYVPLGVGVLLVSLGSDYNLFVVGRIWDRLEMETMREAVRSAGPPASRAIGTAALALALSFALLAVVPLVSFRAFAFGMCAGALIDSFVVRAHLVPSLLSLLGRPAAWPRKDVVVDRARPRVAA